MTPGKYRARIKRIIDGDTVEFDVFLNNETVDLGFYVEATQRVVGRGWKMRLCGINAPESNERGGDEATQFLSDLILGKLVTIETHKVKDKDKRGKYGRWVATITYKGRDVNQVMIHAGHAVTANY